MEAMSDALISDEEAALRVQNEDIEVFGLLVGRYEKKLIRYGTKFLAKKEDIEDIVQEVFISAYQNIQSFNTALRFSPWIYRIAHNAFVNALKAKERRPVLIDFDTLISHPIYEDPEESIREQEEIKERLDACLGELSPKYREVLVLHYFEELAYKDIAEILQVPMGTVGIRLKRAKEELKEVLEKANGRK
jgi:RNA polymerase sigma-70 factor (ECF subfamily)